MAIDNKLLRAVFHEIEPDTRRWGQLVPIVTTLADNTDRIIEKFLKQADMVGNFPKEAFTYTIRYVDNHKLIVVDTRRADRLADMIDDVFLAEQEDPDAEYDPDYLNP